MSWGLIAWLATIGLVVWIFDHPPARPGHSAKAAPQGDLFTKPKSRSTR
ncbi:MAG: hypothetical protein AB7I59_01675 [Geminicoccaceae bacterium]